MNPFNSRLKSLAVLPSVALLPFLFSTNVLAQEAETAEPEPSEAEASEPAADDETPVKERLEAQTGVELEADAEETEEIEEVQEEDEAIVAEPEPAEIEDPEELEADTEEAAAAAKADLPDAKPSLWPFEAGASVFIRPEFREGYDRLGVSRARFQEGDMTVFRTRLALTSQPLPLMDGVNALVNFTPQASGLWGTSGIDGTIGEANLGVYEGYFKVTSERFDFKAGRFAMNYGDAMVIGNLDWHQSARAFDGMHGHYKMDKGYVDLFATQLANGWPAVTDPTFAGDTFFWGAYSGLGGYLDDDFVLDAYFLGLSVAGTEGLVDDTGTAFDRPGATLFHLGARVDHSVDMFDYALEAGLQFGDTSAGAAAVSTLAYHADLQFGLTPVKGTRIALGGALASGDDLTTPENEGYFEMFPTGHKFLGLMDVFGSRTNTAEGRLAFSTGFTDTTIFKLDAHLFARVEDGGLGRTGSDGLAGGEIDTQLVQKIGKYVVARGLYGIFIPNENHYAVSDPAHYVEVQGGLSF